MPKGAKGGTGGEGLGGQGAKVKGERSKVKCKLWFTHLLLGGTASYDLSFVALLLSPLLLVFTHNYDDGER